MTHFSQYLREYRKQAGLTQEQLAQKVEASDKSLSASYISKMETGLLPPPSRKAAVGLADALGMIKRPVNIYIDIKDIDAIKRFLFFLTAYVASVEEVDEIRALQFRNDEGDEEAEQASNTPIPTTIHSALTLPDSILDTTEEEIEAITRLIASTGLTAEEEKMVKSVLLDTTKRLLSFIEAQREMRKDG